MKHLTWLANMLPVALMAVLSAGCAGQDDDTDLTETGDSEQEIVGGTVAPAGAWPGMVALYKGGSRPSCGGTLVADSWVLTAAHCVSTGSTTGGVTKVQIGKVQLSASGGESRTVSAAYRHPRFNRSTLDFDVALLKLSSPSTAPKARVITAEQVAAVVTGAVTTTTGWGTTSAGGSTSDVLRQVDVPVISNTTCKSYSGYSRVTDNMICAGYAAGGKDSCQGDSGGPLFLKIDGVTTQIGLVSWGIGCAGVRAPGVYSRVSNFLPWLAETSAGAVGAPVAPVTPATTPDEDTL